MKLSEYKEALIERSTLLKASIKFTAQRELAYTGNNWASILSTTFFTFSVLIFVKVLYFNVQSIAGYSYNEMLFYFLIYQLTYYGNWVFTVKNLKELIPDVNKGNLDMILIKPVPLPFYLMTRSVSVISLFTEALPPTIAIVLSISWSSLTISPPILFTGFIIWFSGLIVLQTFQFLAALLVFWFGESEDILDLASWICARGANMIPVE